MSDDLKKLLGLVNEEEAIEIKIFKNAVIKNLKEYQESPTRANKMNLDAARETYNNKKESLVKKYLSPPADAGPSFESLLSVCDHLKTAGYRISKSKLYRDRDKGMIRILPDGRVLETEVRAYTANLERIEGDIGDMNDVHARKAAKEIERLDEQIARLRFEREKEEGRYIPKKDFEAELAARAVVFEAGFRHLFNIKTREWIAMVAGRAEKSAELLRDLNQALDEQLSKFSTVRTFQVMFEEE
jgi:hypothetical protein